MSDLPTAARADIVQIVGTGGLRSADVRWCVRGILSDENDYDNQQEDGSHDAGDQPRAELHDMLNV